MGRTSYLNFDLRIEREQGGYCARVSDSPSGQAENRFSLPFSPLELDNFLLRVGVVHRGVRRQESPERQTARDFGGRLFDAVFAGNVLACLRSSIVEAQNREAGLRIRLHLRNTPELMNVPWEVLYDPAANAFPALSTETPLVRCMDVPQPVRPLSVTPPLRVLVMIASPSDSPVLEVEQEWARLHSALADLEGRGLVALELVRDASLPALQRALRHGDYHIFHFVGHGGFDAEAQDGLLQMVDASGRAAPVSGQTLGTLLDQRSLRLAVLNACEGALTAAADPFAGAAQSLLQQKLPAVIAMQFDISDEAAIVFTHEFYSALADGYPVEAALTEARKALFARFNRVEWATPVLYLRAADGRIFDLPAAAGSQPEEAPRETGRKKPEDERREVEQRRRVDVAAPAAVTLGAHFDLAVQVRLPGTHRVDERDWPAEERPDRVAKDSTPVRMHFPVDERTNRPAAARLRIKVIAPDFTIEDSAEQLLEVPPDEASPMLRFCLTANKLGTCPIRVRVSRADGTFLGIVPVRTSVQAGVAGPGQSLGSLEITLDVTPAAPGRDAPREAQARDARRHLVELLTGHFNDSELRGLCFDLGVDYEELAGRTKSDKARELVLYLARCGRLGELVERGRELRPESAAWQELGQERAPAQACLGLNREALARRRQRARRVRQTAVALLAFVLPLGGLWLASPGFRALLAPPSPTAGPIARVSPTPGGAMVVGTATESVVGQGTPTVATATVPGAATAASRTPTRTSTLMPVATAPVEITPAPATPGAISAANMGQVAQLDVRESPMGIRAVLWSPRPAAGNLLAFANNNVYIYDPGSKQVTLDFGIQNWVYALAFSPDGSTLAAAASDGTVLLNVAAGSATRGLAGTTGALAAAFSPDGALLALAIGQTVKVFDAGSGHELATLPAGPDQVETVAFSPVAAPGGEKGYLLVAGGHDIQVWRVAAGAGWDGAAPTVIGDPYTGAEAIAFSPDGKLLAAGSSDGKIRLWDSATGAPVRLFQGNGNNAGGVRELAFSPDGALLASASGEPVVGLWDATTGRLLRSLTGHTSGVATVAFSPDGKLLASGDNGSLRIWGIPTAAQAGTATPAPGPVNILVPVPLAANAIAVGNAGRLVQVDVRDGSRVMGLAWSPHPQAGDLLAVAINNLYLYDPAAKKATVDFGIQNWVQAVAFSPDGATLAATTMVNPAKLLSVEAGVEVRSLPATSGAHAAAYSPDGVLLALAIGQTVKVFDAGSGHELATLPAGPDQVETVAFSPAAAPAGVYLLAAGGHDIETWHVAAGAGWDGAAPTAIGDPYTGAEALVFSPDGKLLAAGSSDGKIRLWDSATGAPVRTLPSHTSGIRALAFAPTGTLLASAAYEPGIALWDVASGRLLRTLTGHTGAVAALAFSPDGAWLASGGEDSTLRLWAVGK